MCTCILYIYVYIKMLANILRTTFFGNASAGALARTKARATGGACAKLREATTQTT